MPKELMGPGSRNTFYRLMISWYDPSKKPKLSASDKEKFGFVVKYLFAHYFFVKIGPTYHRVITFVTQYYPFSLLYRDKLFHAANIKSMEIMRDMESIAANAGIGIDINHGEWHRDLSEFTGKLIKKGMKKQETIQKLQDLFQEKYGSVYVQENKPGFRVLLDSKLIYSNRNDIR